MSPELLNCCINTPTFLKTKMKTWQNIGGHLNFFFFFNFYFRERTNTNYIYVWGMKNYRTKIILIKTKSSKSEDLRNFDIVLHLLLYKTFCHKSGLVVVYRSISMSLDFVDPFATNHRLVRR